MAQYPRRLSSSELVFLRPNRELSNNVMLQVQLLPRDKCSSACCSPEAWSSVCRPHERTECWGKCSDLRLAMWQEAVEDYKITSFIICIPHEVTLGLGRAMAQAVSRWPLRAEARVRARVSPRGICGGQSVLVLLFSPFNIIPPQLSIVIYHLGDEQKVRWWPEFRDIVLHYRCEQHH
jgi:hypothetical protein